MQNLGKFLCMYVTATERKNLLMDLGATACLKKPLDIKDLDHVFAQIDASIPVIASKVLIIEKSPIEREIIGNLLRSKNSFVNLLTASTSSQAREILKDTVFHCIILDLDLEEDKKQGLLLLEEIKSSGSHNNTPIVVFTSGEMREDEEQNLRKWTDAIVVKGGETTERLVAETELFLNAVSKNPQNEKGIQIPPSLENLLNGKKVLLVDDDIRNIYALTSVLQHHGMNVITAINGKDAIRKLEKYHDTDIVLMDIMMPEMDGYLAMQTIRQNEKFRNLPIIALTAKAMKGDREKCIQCGASDYISKPVVIEQLLSLMRVWLYQ